MISKHENGVRVSDLAMQFGTVKSTICTILKNKEAIKGADVANNNISPFPLPHHLPLMPSNSPQYR
jgi:hypothetical protein